MGQKVKNIHAEMTRRDFLFRGSVAALSIPLMGKTDLVEAGMENITHRYEAEPEWRNRQPGMAYRMLGRTGMMISEIVNGGNRVSPDNLRPTEIAVEKGLNYLDTAPQYGRGASETALGKLLSVPSMREKVFLTTKISAFPDFRNNLYREIFDGLPGLKQDAILNKAAEMRRERGVDRPEYFLTYWPGHPGQMDGVFLSNAMMEEYGEKVEGSPGFEKMITESLEGSLRRLGTDHVDILMCPHATSAPEEVNNQFIHSTFEKLKKQGKVRFLGLSTHNDPTNVLKAAIHAGHFDVVMLSYNIVNHGFLDEHIRSARENGMGIIAMKVAMAVSTPYEVLKPIPAWRIEKLNRILPGDMKPEVKAYLWALQNPDLSAVISDMDTEQKVAENLAIAGMKMELQPA